MYPLLKEVIKAHFLSIQRLQLAFIMAVMHTLPGHCTQLHRKYRRSTTWPDGSTAPNSRWSNGSFLLDVHVVVKVCISKKKTQKKYLQELLKNTAYGIFASRMSLTAPHRTYFQSIVSALLLLTQLSEGYWPHLEVGVSIMKAGFGEKPCWCRLLSAQLTNLFFICPPPHRYACVWVRCSNLSGVSMETLFGRWVYLLRVSQLFKGSQRGALSLAGGVSLTEVHPVLPLRRAQVEDSGCVCWSMTVTFTQISAQFSTTNSISAREMRMRNTDLDKLQGKTSRSWQDYANKK